WKLRRTAQLQDRRTARRCAVPSPLRETSPWDRGKHVWLAKPESAPHIARKANPRAALPIQLPQMQPESVLVPPCRVDAARDSRVAAGVNRSVHAFCVTTRAV